MYLAEIHGKLSRENENKEDNLTSNVFSFFKYANREIFLYNLVKSIGLNISAEDAIQAELHFWPSFPDRTEPDLIINMGNYYVLIEAKFHSGFSQETINLKHQLVREVENGVFEAENLGKIFKIIIVTADYYQKREIIQNIPRHHHKDLIWINWQYITYLIYDILETKPRLSSESRFLAEDLYTLLLKKNLRNFEGVAALSSINKLQNNPEAVFFQAKTSIYRGDFIGFIQAFEGTKRLSSTPNTLFYEFRQNLFHGLRRIDKLSSKDTQSLFFTRS
jgi:hypothetical protein